MRILILAAVAATPLLVAAAPAAAQDRAPFTGPHVEAIVGGDRVQAGGDHDNGLGYGVAAGWDFKLSPKVRAGLEVEAADSTEKECATITGAGGGTACAKAGRDLYAGVRAGTMLGDATLLYAKAGYSNARFTASLAGDHASTTLDGLRVGLGLEHAFGPHAFVKGEYRYTNYQHGAERHQLMVGAGYRF